MMAPTPEEELVVAAVVILDYSWESYRGFHPFSEHGVGLGFEFEMSYNKRLQDEIFAHTVEHQFARSPQ